MEDQDFDNNKIYIKEVEWKGLDWNDVVPTKDLVAVFQESFECYTQSEKFIDKYSAHGVNK